eukprot:TRINITY_DN2964_c0_g1_i2.p1 TRINITY_DN2964_c0_g1~~TRINITY_DN2964_c0_g1_i2.p1  ORF type:complete len:470 (+),score=128.92 TRINITY_DN2964_c0_g1_i2:88-1497(+)
MQRFASSFNQTIRKERLRTNSAFLNRNRLFSSQSTPSQGNSAQIVEEPRYDALFKSSKDIRRTIEQNSKVRQTAVRVSLKEEQRLREIEVQQELQRRYPNNEWISEPDFTMPVNINSARKIMLVDQESAVKKKEVPHDFSAYFNNLVDKQNAMHNKLKNYSLEMNARYLTAKEMHRQKNEEDLENIEMKNVDTFSRLFLNAPFASKILRMVGFEKVEVRQPPKKITLSSLKREDPSKRTAFDMDQDAESILREYKKIYGFVKEPDEEPFPRKDPETIEQPDKEAWRPAAEKEPGPLEKNEPYKATPGIRGVRTNNTKLEEWEREDIFRNYVEEKEELTRQQLAERRKQVAKKRWIFEDAWAYPLRAEEPKVYKPGRKRKLKAEAGEEEEPKLNLTPEEIAEKEAADKEAAERQAEIQKEMMAGSETEPVDEALAEEIRLAEEARKKTRRRKRSQTEGRRRITRRKRRAD